MPSLGSPTLVLFPTELEHRRFADQGGLPNGVALQSLCGFGPVAAAARASQLLAELTPSRVLLVGIAGAYDVERYPIGTALDFGQVAIEGIGAGEGRDLSGPPALGFPQWPGSPTTTDGPVLDTLPLATREEHDGLLLTTCAASAGADQTNVRRQRFPEATAEDMEGFAVALACALARVPLRIVRGISNAVGVREPSAWRIPAALAAARRRALVVLEAPW